MSEGEKDQDLPVLDFATFVLSLSHSAFVHLGLAPNPETQRIAVDLSLAKQTIDVVAMLEEKTKGNLTGEEERLIEQILYDLRLRYVERAKEKAPEKTKEKAKEK